MSTDTRSHSLPLLALRSTKFSPRQSTCGCTSNKAPPTNMTILPPLAAGTTLCSLYPFCSSQLKVNVQHLTPTLDYTVLDEHFGTVPSGAASILRQAHHDAPINNAIEGHKVLVARLFLPTGGPHAHRDGHHFGAGPEAYHSQGALRAMATGAIACPAHRPCRDQVLAPC